MMRRVLLGSVAVACATLTALVFLIGSGAGVGTAGHLGQRVSGAHLVSARVVASSASVVSGTASAADASVRSAAYGRALGLLPAGTILTANVQLKPRDSAGLSAYATAVGTRGSAVYHHYLSVAGFRALFGPTATAVDSVLARLRALGLDPGAVTANGLAVPVTATAAALSRAFGVRLERYDDHGQHVYATVGRPRLGAGVDGFVQAVTGLDDLGSPTSSELSVSHAGHVRGASDVTADVSPGPAPTGTGCAADTVGGYSADEIAGAYSLDGFYDTGDLGSGEKIALLEQEGYNSADLSAYENCYVAAQNPELNVVPVQAPPSSSTTEATTDIEGILSVAPKAEIDVYETGATLSDQLAAWDTIVSDNSDDVVSTSWDACESEAQTAGVIAGEAADFEEAAAQGQTVLAASGDSGSAGCLQGGGSASTKAVDDPASQPFVTAVGGTSLSYSFGSPASQTVWNSGSCSAGDPFCASGGGVSSLWKQPSYQDSAVTAVGSCAGTWTTLDGVSADSSGCRQVPDVAADADPDTGYQLYVGGSWASVGGTSLAAPFWAGFIALTDASSGEACGGTEHLGFLNGSLYRLGESVLQYPEDFTDITSGSNATNSTAGGYSAGSGFDDASGLGTPIGTALAADLCNDLIVVKSLGTQGPTIAGSSVSVGVTATAEPGDGVSYSADGLPAGLSIDSSTGKITGHPTTPGSYEATVIATDTSNGDTAETSFDWTVLDSDVSVTAPPSQSWTVSNSVSLQVHGADAGSGATLTYSASSLPAGLSISSTGVISGTPTTASSGTAQIVVSDGTSGPDSTATTTFSWSVVSTAVSVSAVPTQNWTVGGAVSLQLSASDTGTNQSFTWASSALPAGLSLSSSGLISGTPTTASTGYIQVVATDSSGSQGQATFAITVVQLLGTSVPAGGGSTGSQPGGPAVIVSSAAVPTATAAASGAATNKPKLTVTVKSAVGASLTKFSFHLPAGYSASASAKKIAAGIKAPAGAKVTVSGSTVTVTLKKAATSATVTLGSPDLSVSAALAKLVKKHKAKAESFAVTVTTVGGAQSVTVALSPR